uniref:C2H2-type domain-containing protein n=1 Tax=Clastoptera arizonana TaxID=38151 RepID=A0A1B6D2M0_9HEMI
MYLVSDWRHNIFAGLRVHYNMMRDSNMNPPALLKCQSCNRMYRSKFTLWRHLKYECGKEPKFECTICSKKAYYKTEMWRHMKTKHNDVIPEHMFSSDLKRK